MIKKRVWFFWKSNFGTYKFYTTGRQCQTKEKYKIVRLQISIYGMFCTLVRTQMKILSVTHKMILLLFHPPKYFFLSWPSMTKESFVLHQFLPVKVNELKMLQKERQQVGVQGFIFKNKKRLWKKQGKGKKKHCRQANLKQRIAPSQRNSMKTIHRYQNHVVIEDLYVLQLGKH